MNKVVGMTINMPDGNRARIDRHLASGNLADVYAVDTTDSGSTNKWVVKILKEADSTYLDTEYEVLSRLKRDLPPEQSKMIPAFQRASVGEERVLLIEQMSSEDSLLEYMKREHTYRDRLSWEKHAWELATLYTQFIYQLHLLGLTCNDRKLGDFYYIPAQNRLVILDWNVIEDRRNSKRGPSQDAVFLARIWFNLFGGSDETRFQISNSELKDISISGIGFLLRILNPEARSKIYHDDARIAQTLERELGTLLSLFGQPLYKLEDELQMLVRQKPLERISNTEMTLTDLEWAVLPYWEFADMLDRRGQGVKEKRQIEHLLEEHRQATQQDFIRKTQLSASETLKRLQEIRETGSISRQALLQSWKHQIIDLLQVASAAGISPEPIRDFIFKFQQALEASINARLDTPLPEIQAFKSAYDDLQALFAHPEIAAEAHLCNALQQRLTQLEIYLACLEGEKALLDVDAKLAIAAFQRADRHLNHLTGNLKQMTGSLLPYDPSEILIRLQALDESAPIYIEHLLNAMQQGDFGQAVQIAESALASRYIPYEHRLAIEQWARPAYLVRAIQVNAIQEWAVLLTTANELSLYKHLYPQVTTVIRQLIKEATAHFMKLAQPPYTPAHDLKAFYLGQQLAHLNALNIEPSQQ